MTKEDLGKLEFITGKLNKWDIDVGFLEPLYDIIEKETEAQKTKDITVASIKECFKRFDHLQDEGYSYEDMADWGICGHKILCGVLAYLDTH